MTKRRLLLLLFLLTLVGITLLIKKPWKKAVDYSLTPSPAHQVPAIDPANLKIAGQRVIGLKKGHEKEDITKLKVANTPSPEWKEGLTETLKAQGGPSLRDITFEKVDSFVWAQDGVALFVESVIVTIKNENNASTTFRVLVDAQNGKILKNWDQPVIDPVNPRESFRIKIDPRYHTD
jgi:hypothetical protein